MAVTVEKVSAEEYESCRAQVTDPMIRKGRSRNGEAMRCANLARYRVNGICLCRRHAGAIVLDLHTSDAK